MNLAPALALTMGEPAGIGGDITLTAWVNSAPTLPPFFVIDDPMRLTELARKLDLATPIQVIDSPEDAVLVFQKALPVIPLTLSKAAHPGEISPANQPMVRASIESAVALVLNGRAAALVTNPIHKHALYDSGFKYPGHTEFLAALAGVETSVMMLASPQLRVVPVTIHKSLKSAIGSLDTASIITAARITADALRRYFGIGAPRLAVAGLNPHAGENGALGTEENEIIFPAVKALCAAGIDVIGPVAPDTLFCQMARAEYDAAICMYHDQALIPIKTLDVDNTVNVTLGLPFVRTSPDHGTALDIAGTGRANPSSLVAALHLANQMVKARLTCIA
jgi:4-hydroxythreonine-4-phosphate dehydrogenase